MASARAASACAGQRPLHPTQLLIAAGQQPPAALDAVGQLGQRVGQQRQRLPAVGVGDQPRHQVRRRPRCRPAAPGPRSPRGAPPAAAAAACARVSAARPAPGRPAAGRGIPGAAWPRPAPGRPAPGPAARRTGPARRRGLGEQLLELVDHEQQRASARPGRGQQQVVGQLGQPAVVEPARESRPSTSPARAAWAACGQLPGQRRHRSRPGRIAGTVYQPGSPAITGSSPARTSDDFPHPDGPTTSSTAPSARSAGDRSRSPAARPPGCGRRTPGAGRCRTAAARETATGRPASPSPPAASTPPQRLGQLRPGRAPGPSPRRRAAPPSAADGRPRVRPASAAAGSPAICAIPSSAVHHVERGRPRSAGTPPRRPSAAAHAAAAPTPPRPRCRARIVIEEHLVAVLAQPALHLVGRGRVRGRVADEHPGHGRYPGPARADTSRDTPAHWRARTAPRPDRPRPGRAAAPMSTGIGMPPPRGGRHPHRCRTSPWGHSTPAWLTLRGLRLV